MNKRGQLGIIEFKYFFVGLVIGIILGLLFLVGAGTISSFASQNFLLGAIGAGLFVVIEIILIGFSILGFFVGRGLWKARPWARIVAIILSALGILVAAISMIQGNIVGNIVSLVIQLVIGGYLLFSSNVKKAFS